MGNLPDIVKAIALNNKIDESRDFASMVQASMHERLGKADRNARDLGVKQAPFMVLIGATMPSVLAEVSFLTNGDEGRAPPVAELPPADRRGAPGRGDGVSGLAQEDGGSAFWVVDSGFVFGSSCSKFGVLARSVNEGFQFRQAVLRRRGSAGCR